MSQAQPFNLPPPPIASHQAPEAHPARAQQRWERIEAFYLQWGHRAATLALFAFAAAAVCAMKAVGPYGMFLAAAVVAADLGLVGSVLSWWTQRRQHRPTRESIGLLAFNFIVLMLAVTLYVLAKNGWLQPLIGWVLALFPSTNA